MKASSRFYSSLGLLVVLNVLIKPVWIFFIDRQVQNQVGTTSYGVYFSLLNFSIVFSFLLDWGFTAFVNRQVATDEGMIYRISQLLRLKMLFVLVYAAVVFGAAFLTGIKEWEILLKVAGIQILTSLFIFLRAIITAQQWFRTDAWLSVLDKTLVILLCAGFIYLPATFGTISINIFLWMQLASTAFAIVCAILILQKKGILLFETRPTPGKNALLKAALPFALIILLMSAHYRLDGFLLERLHSNGAYEAGLYAGAYRLLDAANMVGYLFASFLLPFIAKQHHLNQDTRSVVLHSRHVLLLFALFISLAAIFMAPWIQRLLYHNNDGEAITVLQLSIPALIGYSAVQVYGTVLTATGHIVAFCRIVLVAVLLNITGNIIMIPGMGARGAAIAALFSQGFCGIATLVYAHKKCNTDIHARSILMYTFIGAVVSIILYAGVRKNINEWWLLAGAGIVVVLLAFVTRILDWKRWIKFFKQTQSK
jgi:O-antigen/teichoic acid export membrane protein